MAQIDKYTAGSVTLTNGQTLVTGVSTAWCDAAMTKFSVLAGHFLRIGTFVSLIVSVNSPTSLTLAQPYTGATASGLTYEIYRTSYVETSAAVGMLQALALKGSASSPLAALYLDNSVMRMALRDDGSGNPSLYVGGTGAADGAMPRVFSVDKTTGNLWTASAKIGVGTAGGAINFAMDVRGGCAATQYWAQKADGTTWPDAWIGGITGLDSVATHNFLHIGGATSSDGQRRISLQASMTHVGGLMGVGVTAPGAALHVVDVASQSPLRLGVNNSNAPVIQLYKGNGASNQKYWDFNFTSDGSVMSLRALDDAYSASATIFDVLRSGYTPTGIYFGTAVNPNVDNGRTLGGPGLRWAGVYAGTGAINTSDATLKQIRGHFSDVELDAWGEIHGCVYQFLDAVAAKGEDAARLHSGWIAQEVAAAFAAHGLDARRYALFCADPVAPKVKSTETRQRQAVDAMEVTEDVIKVIDGVPTVVEEVRTVQVPRTTQQQVIGKDGKPLTRFTPDPVAGDVDQDGVRGRMEPVLHDVPVMEAYEAEIEIDGAPEERLGLRYEEALVLETAWLRRELARQGDRITALEARAAA